MATKELQKKDFGPKFRALVVEAVQEVLSDPDFGLELRPEFKKRLLASYRNNRQRGISLAEVKRRYL